MITLSYWFTNGEKHTFVFHNLNSYYDKLAEISNVCFDKKISVTISIKINEKLQNK